MCSLVPVSPTSEELPPLCGEGGEGACWFVGWDNGDDDDDDEDEQLLCLGVEVSCKFNFGGIGASGKAGLPSTA